MEKLLESLGVDVQDENLLQKEIIRQRILNMIEFPSKNYFMIPALSDTSNLPILSNKSSLLLLNELKSELNQYELYSENYNKCYFKYLFFAKLYRENNYPAETITEGEEEDVRRVEVVREVMESKGDSNPRNVRKKNDAEGEGEEWEEEITLPKQLRKKISCEAVKSNEANAKILNANCPLCNQIISIGSYHSIDLAVGQHIDSLCNQNTSKRKRSSRIPPPDPSPPNDRVSQRTRSSVLQNRTQRTTRSSSSRVVSHEADEDEEEEYECEQEDQDEEEEQEEENVSHLRNMNMKFSRVSGAPVRDDWEDDVFYTRLLEYELNLPSVAATATATNEEEPLPVSEDMPIDLSPRHSGHNDQVRSQNLKSRVKEGEIVTSHGSIVEESTWNDLYEYQREGVKWMWELYLSGGGTGGILGDEMGLGKTVQLCTHYSSIANEEISRQRSSPSSASATNMNPQHRPLLLVVCPATVQQHWLQEFHKWAPRLRVVILHSISPTFSALNSMGPAAIKRAINKISQSTDGESYGVVLIVSYESLRILQKLLLSIRWVAVTLDEGQKIKNPDTSITLLCKDLATYHRLILSGTPIQNNLKELWSLFDFVFPGRLGTLATFETEFATPIKLGGYQNATKLQIEIAIKSATILQQMIQPFLLRRKKDQINHLIHLPKKTEQVLFCTLSPTQRAIYQEIIHSEELQAAIRYKKPLFAAIMTLRKLCNHPMLAYQVGQIQWHDSKNEDREEEAIRLLSTSASSTQWKNGGTSNSNSRSKSSTSLDKNSLHWKDSGKLLVLSHILPLWKQENHKILIFCQMYSMISLLEIMLNELSLPFMRLDGRTPVSKRQQIINHFNSEPQPQGEVDEEEEDGDDNNGDGNGNGNDRRRRRRNSPRISILLLTTRTGGVGISLTGANRVILVDPDWNPQIDIQARERAWRIGQKRDVIIYRLITRGTIEEKIYHRQIFKLLLTNRILENPKQKRFFSKHDIEELFELENFGTSNSLPADPDLEISFDEQPAERREEKQGTGADSRGEGGEVRGGAGRDLEEGEVRERMEISSEMISTIDSTIATVLQLEQQLAMSSSSTPSSASSTSAAGSLSSSTSPPPPPSDPDLYPSVHEQEDRDHQLLRALYNGEAIAAVYDHSYFEGNGGGKRIAKNTAAAIAHEKQIKQLAQQVVDEAVKQLRNSNPSIVSSSSRDRLGFIEERSTPRGHGNGGRGRGGRFSSNSQRSSSSMLSGLRQLQGRSLSQEDGSGSGNGSSDLRNVSEGQMTSTVLARLENIFRQRASTGTGAVAGAEDRSGLTTDEILAHFSDLPDQFAPIFREMLRRVAVFSEGRWKANAATTLN